MLFDSAVAIVEEEIQVAEDGWLQFAAEEEATLLATAPELLDEWSIRPPQLALQRPTGGPRILTCGFSRALAAEGCSA